MWYHPVLIRFNDARLSVGEVRTWRRLARRQEVRLRHAFQVSGEDRLINRSAGGHRNRSYRPVPSATNRNPRKAGRPDDAESLPVCSDRRPRPQVQLGNHQPEHADEARDGGLEPRTSFEDRLRHTTGLEEMENIGAARSVHGLSRWKGRSTHWPSPPPQTQPACRPRSHHQTPAP
jgi:hypothetical protein